MEVTDSLIEKLQALRPKETYGAHAKCGYFLAVRDAIAALQPSATMGADEPKGISLQVGDMPPSVDEPCPAPATHTAVMVPAALNSGDINATGNGESMGCSETGSAAAAGVPYVE